MAIYRCILCNNIHPWAVKRSFDLRISMCFQALWVQESPTSNVSIQWRRYLVKAWEWFPSHYWYCKVAIMILWVWHTKNFLPLIPNLTLGLLLPVSRALLAELRRNYGARVIRRCLSGTGPEGVVLALWACIDVRVYLRGETARAATQKLPPREHTHMAVLFTNTLLAFHGEGGKWDVT